MWGDTLTNNLDISGSSPTNITNLQNIAIHGKTIEEISFGSSHGSALDSNGDLWIWGLNPNGQLGNGTFLPEDDEPINITQTTESVSDPEWINPLYGKTISQISLGGYNSLVLDDSGELWMWGRNEPNENELGNQDTGDMNTAVNITNQFTFIYNSYIFESNNTSTWLNYSLIIDDNYNINQFSVYYRTNDGQWIEDTSPTVGNNIIQLTNLTPGTSYNYEIVVMINENSEETPLAETSGEFIIEQIDPKTSTGLNTAEIVGIVMGSIIGLTLIGIVVLYIFMANSKKT